MANTVRLTSIKPISTEDQTVTSSISVPMQSSSIQNVELNKSSVATSNEGRTPRLSRGAENKKMVVYRKDLSETNSQDITMVIFAREKGDENEKVPPVNENNTSAYKSRNQRRSITILPSEEDVGSKPPEVTSSQDDKKKKLSFFSKSVDKEKSSKRSFQVGKRLSKGSLLSKFSMPNLSESSYSEPLSPENEPFLKRITSKKGDSVHLTGWTFHSTNDSVDNAPQMNTTQSSMYLSAIDEANQSSFSNVRAVSMNDLSTPYSSDNHSSLTTVYPSSPIPDNPSIETDDNQIEPIHIIIGDHNEYSPGITSTTDDIKLGIDHPMNESEQTDDNQVNDPHKTKEFTRFTKSRKPVARKQSFTTNKEASKVKASVVSSSNSIITIAPVSLPDNSSPHVDLSPENVDNRAIVTTQLGRGKMVSPVSLTTRQLGGIKGELPTSPNGSRNIDTVPDRSTQVTGNTATGVMVLNSAGLDSQKSQSANGVRGKLNYQRQNIEGTRIGSGRGSPVSTKKISSEGIGPGRVGSGRGSPVSTKKISSEGVGPGRIGSGRGSPISKRKGSSEGISPGRVGSGRGSPVSTKKISSEGIGPGRIGSGRGSAISAKKISSEGIGPGRVGSGRGSPISKRKGSSEGISPGRIGSGRGSPVSTKKISSGGMGPGRVGSGRGSAASDNKKGSKTSIRSASSTDSPNSSKKDTNGSVSLSTSNNNLKGVSPVDNQQSVKTSTQEIAVLPDVGSEGYKMNTTSSTSSNGNVSAIGTNDTDNVTAVKNSSVNLTLQIATDDTSELPLPLTSPDYRRRRIGISSVSSPLTDDNKEFFTKPLSSTKTQPLSDTTNEHTSSSSNKRQNTTTKESNVAQTSKYVSTYVYQSRKVSNNKEPTPSSTNETQSFSTYKYVSSSQSRDKLRKSLPKKSDSQPNVTKDSQTDSQKSKNDTEVRRDIKKENSYSGITNKKPPSGAKRPSNRTMSPKNTDSLKKNSKSDELSSSMNILTPVSSLISTPSLPSTDAPLSPPPVIGVMRARPISPTSPLLSPDEDNQAHVSTSPAAGDDQLTYIYRQTLLRKSSKPDTLTRRGSTSIKHTTSPSHEAKKKSIERTTSPRKSSLPTTSDQSSPQRKGKITTSRENSLGRSSMKRKSSKRFSVQTTSTPALTSKTPSPLLRASETRSSSRKSTKTASSESSSSNPNTPTPSTVKATLPKDKTGSFRKVSKPALNSRGSLRRSVVHSHAGSNSEAHKSTYDRRGSLKHKTSTSSLAQQSVQASKSPLESVDSTKLHRGSIRLSRRSSAGTISKGSPNRGTLKRMTNSATHTPLSRGSSIEKDETVTAFDAISSMAQKNLLSTASDHKRAVRPKLRQKPSATHMQILNDRKDISNDLEKAAGNTSKVDPNSYSTYMSKKVLDPTALAGLAAKLDFTTVKLKKTGIVEQMIADTQISKRGATDSHTQYGVEFTSHPVMLLHIKGRKLIQTRLAQPVASSVNSGDVFILLTKKDLFIFQGKTSNVIEKARGTDIVNRIQQRSELGCCAKSVVHIEENDNFSEKSKSFWNILQGKQPMKEDTSPSDDVYEKKINLTTRIYVFVQEGDNVGKYTQINEESPAMPKIAILDSKKIFVFDFFTEVYVWIGKRSPVAQRKSAVIKARKIFESNGSPPSFKNTNATPASPSRKISITGGTRASGRFSTKQRYGTLNSSARRKSSRTLERKSSKSDLVARPDWSLFTSLGEGSETILFREKFADWPEPGRIIKMKGHESSGEVHKPPPMPELQPVDTKTMLKPRAKFEGLRLDGENIHRGLGNFKVTRSTFACNRVRSQNISVYQVKEYESVLMDEKRNGLLYSGEGYVIRWSYIITVVKELEGLTSVNRSSDRKSRGAESFNEGTDELEFDDEGTNDKTRQMLESGGRNCCAYFFWQGQNASINEKGATAVLTILMDTEKGAQIRVLQGKEHPAFLQLFKGGLIVLLGKSQNNELVKCSKGYRLYYCGGSRKREAYLLEINSNQKSLSYFLRSRGCYVVQHEPSSSVYLWMGGQATDVCCNVAKFAAKNLIQRLDSYKLINVTEGKEPPDLKSLLGSESIYQMPSSSLSYSPRLFMLSSSSGWFVADEVVHSACPDTDDLVDTFPFLQQDLYEAIQPTTFLLDCYFVIYLWIGWWPEQKNVLFKEKNAFAGTALSRWARDKKLSIQTAINYANDCKRDPLPKVYVVNAGHEHHEFVSMFPIWNEDLEVKSLVAKEHKDSPIPDRVLAETELAKYTRAFYTLDELKSRPPEIDHNKLESYLSDEDFKAAFKMSKDEFSNLLSWKQVNLKKSLGLF